MSHDTEKVKTVIENNNNMKNMMKDREHGKATTKEHRRQNQT